MMQFSPPSHSVYRDAPALRDSTNAKSRNSAGGSNSARKKVGGKAKKASKAKGDEPGSNEHGLQALAASLGAHDVDLCSLPPSAVNFINALASKQRVTSSELTLSRSEVHNLKNDKDAMSAAIAAYESKVFSMEQECATYRLKFESTSKQFREEKGKLTQERDELRSLNVRLSGRDEQYRALARKHEVDYARLQKQLQTLSNQRTKDAKYKAFQSTGSIRGVKGKGGAVDKNAYFTKLVSSLEMRQGELLEENNDLRSTLRGLHAEVQGLVDKYDVIHKYISRARKTEAEEEERVQKLSVEAARFNMPMDWLKTNVSEALFSQLLALKERCAAIISDAEGEEAAKSGASSKPADESAVVKKLRKKVKDLQDIVMQQDDIIQAAIFTERQGGGDEAGLDVSGAEEIEEERRMLRNEREELDERWAEVERMKMGEFIDAQMDGALKEKDEDGRVGIKEANSPMITIGFEATPVTTKILADAGIRAVKEDVKVKPDDLFD